MLLIIEFVYTNLYNYTELVGFALFSARVRSLGLIILIDRIVVLTKPRG